MKKILNICQKNMRLLLRSKSSTLVILLGPLILMILVGLAFSTAQSNKFRIGIYSDQYSNLTMEFIEELSDDFQINRFKTIDMCKRSIEMGETHLCIEFPPDFSVELNKSNQLLFYVDYSNINLVYSVLNSVTTNLNIKTDELSRDLTNLILDTLRNTGTELDSNNATFELLQRNLFEAKGYSDAMYSKILLMNLGFSLDEYPISTIKEKAGKNRLYINDLEAEADDAISEGKSIWSDVESDLDSIEGKLNSENLSTSNVEDIRNVIEDATDELNNISDDLDSVYSDSVENAVNLSDEIDVLEDKLNTHSTQLTSASELKGDITASTASLNEHLDDVTGNLNSLIGVNSNLLLNILELNEANAGQIVQPISTKIVPLRTDKTPFHYMIPSLLTIVLMFTCLLLASTLVIMEKASNAYFRNFITPTKDIKFLVGSFISTFIVVFVQLLIIAGFAFQFFDIASINFLNLIVVIFLTSSTFILVGMIFGNLLKSEETSVLATITMGFIFLGFSNLILPIEQMPAYMISLAKYNPFIIGSELIRQVLLFDLELAIMQTNIMLLALYSVLFFVIAFVLLKLSKKNFILKYAVYTPPKKKLSEMKLRAKLSQLEPLTPFYTNDGNTIQDFREMIKKLELMIDDSFKEYVDGDKNMIADWIEESYKNKRLATKLRQVKSKQKIIKMLEKANKEYDKLKKKVEECEGLQIEEELKNEKKRQELEEKKEKQKMEGGPREHDKHILTMIEEHEEKLEKQHKKSEAVPEKSNVPAKDKAEEPQKAVKKVLLKKTPKPENAVKKNRESDKIISKKTEVKKQAGTEAQKKKDKKEEVMIRKEDKPPDKVLKKPELQTKSVRNTDQEDEVINLLGGADVEKEANDVAIINIIKSRKKAIKKAVGKEKKE